MWKEPPKFKPEEILVYLRKARSDVPALTVEEVLKNHEIKLHEWEDRNLSEKIPEENWYREVASGESLSERQEFQKILGKLELPEVKAILCTECQRISRGDMEECGRIMNLIRYSNVFIITPYKTYDLSDEYDRDGFKRELERGNDYLEYFKRIQKRGIELSISSGNYLGRVAPFGYKKIRVLEGKRWCPTLEVVPDQARIVKQIFEWYAEGMGCHSIVTKLHEMGYKNASGSTKWCVSSIKAMIRNEHYIGKIRYYYRVKKRNVVNQQIVKSVERQEDYLLHEGKHEAIIDEELFYRANNRRVNMPRYKKSTELVNPLATFFYCSCGGCMDYKFDRDVVDEEGRRKRRYACSHKRYCRTPSVKEDLIFNDVITALKKEVKNFEVKVKANDDSIYKAHQEHIDYLKTKLAEAEKKELALWEKYAEGMPKQIFQKLLEKNNGDKEVYEKALEKAYKDIPKKVDYEDKICNFHAAIDALNDKSISAEQKNRLLRACIEKIIYTREPAIKVTATEARELGISAKGGWYMKDYDLDIHLLI